MKRNFTFSAKFQREIKSLTDSQQLEAYRMIVRYGLEGVKPEAFSDEAVGVAWSRILAIFNEEEAKKNVIPENMFESEEEQKFYEFMGDAYPLLVKFDQPLTYRQYETLKRDFGKEKVDNIIFSLGNMRGANKKYVSVYATVRMWLMRNSERSTNYAEKAAATDNARS